MKKSILSILFTLSVILFYACGGKEQANNEKIVLTSFYPIYIATKNVAAGVPNIVVKNMAKQETGCLHDYQLTPEDLKNISSSWLFITNGSGMESFLDKIISKYPKLIVSEASKSIPLIEDGYNKESNPHVWVSISLEILQVQNIRDVLSGKDPEHAHMYNANADRYIKKLESLKQKMHQELSAISSRDIITFHEAFPYFAKEFNLNIVSVIEREPGSEPNSKELAETIETIRTKKVKAIFAEPQYPAKAANTIARETNIQIYTLDPAVSGPDSLNAYIKIMERNLSTLKKALK